MEPTVKTNPIPVACFAPPLTDAKLAELQTVVDGLPVSAVKDAMRQCLVAVQQWWKLPDSESTPETPQLRLRHGGKSVSVPVRNLSEANLKALFDAVPWEHELQAIEKLFETIPPANAAIRNAAFYLLWFAKELCLDREPLTGDVLP